MPTWKRKIRDMKWWVLHRYSRRHRYNIIETGLPPGYYDIDVLMLHGMFSLLRRYIEDEMGGVEEVERLIKHWRENPDPHFPEGTERQASNDEKALELYRWWTIEKPADDARYRELMSICYRGSGRVTFEKDVVTGCRAVKINVDVEADAHKELEELNAKIERDEQKNLVRLIYLRKSLWT